VADPLTLTTTSPGPHAVSIGVRGDLDHATADELLEAATAVLAAGRADSGESADSGPGDATGLRDLRLDCSGLGLCDSSGLAALLVIRRRAGAAGVRLHLDHRGTGLDRLLDLTGTLEHLTGEPASPPGGTRDAEGARSG
jgi:anti-anti-sigma regulatory factor